jgi:NitT/TauT family transport system permease protein
VITGILLGRSDAFANVLGPLTELARPIPAIAIVPVAILLFPTDEAGIVFITFLAAYFPIMVSTRHAVRALPTIWEDSVRTLGGGAATSWCAWSSLGSFPVCSAVCRSASASPGSASSPRR